MTEPVYATYAIEYYDGAQWVDITADTQNPRASWGMRSDSHTDRLANTGQMTFTAINNSGGYDPDNAAALTGWGKNTQVRWKFTFDGITYVRFYGTIDRITLNDPSVYEHTANVTVVDWLNYAYKFPLKAPAIELEKRADQAIASIVTAMGTPPQATAYSQGANVYDAVFDTVSGKTKASTELNKIVMSDMGYLYARKDRANGETLVFESAADRNGLREVSLIPKVNSECAYLVDESGNYLTDESGNKLLSSDAEAAYLNDTAQGYKRAYGEDIVNEITIAAYPKEVDTSLSILYKLDSPIKLAAGETKTVEGTYSNATTKKACNAISTTMVAPVATTDYLMNRSSDGTGANLTANLTVTAEFGTERVKFTLTNASAYTGYVTKLNARGYGVYANAALEETLSDTTSQTAYAVSTLKIDQPYMRDTAAGKVEGEKILNAEKDPRTVLQSVTFGANKSNAHMQMFLNMDIGDMTHIAADAMDLDSYHYIQGIDFSAVGGANGAVITCAWTLKDAPLSLYTGTLTQVAVEFTASEGQVINFGVIPDILDLQERTVLLSVYPHTDSDAQVIYQIGSDIYSSSENPFQEIYFNLPDGKTNLAIRYLSRIFTSDTLQQWETNNANPDVPLNAWSRIAVTHRQYDPAADPGIYVNGTACSLYLDSGIPTGYPDTQDGTELHIGGAYNGATVTNLFDGLIKDVKIYNRILSAAEIAAEYAGTAITNGLVFHGLCIPTKQTAAYYDAALTTSQKIYDNIHGNIGTPVNAPVCREIA